ncbi:MAG: hypothetical protein E7663_04815 [Ruminococcaceae bacterium]|nr:hypothetical protein [Oscillospiraceae bacterium]
MSKYIDLEKAIERLNASPAFSNFGADGYFLLGVVEDLLNKQPAADILEKLTDENNALIVSGFKDCPITQMRIYRVREQHPVVMAIEAYGATQALEELEKFIERKRRTLWQPTR